MHSTFVSSRLVRFAVLGALALVVLAGCGGQSAEQETTPSEAAAPAVDAASAVVTDESGTRVTLEVTDDGFVPPLVVVPAGKPVTLVVTRKTERTCATEVVMAQHGINLALPLNQTVEASFTPTQAETLGYACAMDMYKGKIVVQ